MKKEKATFHLIFEKDVKTGKITVKLNNSGFQYPELIGLLEIIKRDLLKEQETIMKRDKTKK